MTELSNVLREVLRALGVEGWERAGLAGHAREAVCEPGDFHAHRQPVEFERV